MKKKLGSVLLSSLLFCTLVLSTQISFALITVNGISTVPSSCGNNGSATISASSSKSNPFLIYEIIAGPATAPLQNNSTFSSLFPGTYTVRIYDVDFVSKDAQFTVGGNYQLPTLNPIPVNPICPGFSDGMIIGNANTSSGKAPFNWQIISPYTSAIQSSDTFKQLTSGTYTIRMTDACGNFQSRTVILVAGGTGLAPWYEMVPSILKIGCDKVALSQYFSMYKEKAKMPLKMTINTSSGTITKRVYPIPLDTINYTPGLFEIRDTIAGITYGSYLYLCLTDTCGQSICATKATVSPFEFYLEYYTGAKCGNTMSASVQLKNPPQYPAYMYTTYKKPAKMTLTDIATNTIADSMTCFDNYCALSIKEQVSGRNYHLKIVDGCGEVFEQDILWPIPAQPSVQVYPGVGCMDSTAYAGFNIWNFKSDIKLEIISGPTTVGSTKPHYAFQDVITYPKTYPVIRNNGFSLKNLPVGTYEYRVYDSCNNEVRGTFSVDPIQVANFSYSYKIKKGCLGDNILYFDATSQNTAGVYVRDIATNNILYQFRGAITPDSLTSLPPGKYLLEIYYGYYYVGGQFFDGTLTDSSPDCWAVFDTITIPPYSNNTFKSNTTIFCNGNSYVELNVDSTRGVPPYQYEITSGPQTFPIQSSNIFNIPTYGDYVIRVQDACGNSNIRQISIDSAKFAPVIKKGASCMGRKITLAGISSSHFQYEWRKPNGTIYIGDSLVINPLTMADTGQYLITKIVTINGCSDRFTSTYHLYATDVTKQTILFCHGTTVQVGPKTYNSPGVYTDTLTNILGCDSIVITSLIAGYKKDSVSRSICPGNTIIRGLHTYSQTGIYRDTLISINGCDSILILNLTVLPYKRSTINKSICPGKTINFGGHTYNMAGTYYDTLTTTSCDSIVTLHLTNASPPIIYLGKDTSLCQGQSLLLEAGNNYVTYFWNNNFSDSIKHNLTVNSAGKYWVTVKNSAGCTKSDTLEVLNLYPLPVAAAGNDQSLCSGTTVIISASGGTHYKWIPTGDQLPTIQVHPSVTTTYSVIAYDLHECASLPDQVTIHINPSPTKPPFENETMAHCFDEGPVTLSASWGKTFLWTTGETTQSIVVQQEGVYKITVYDDSGCFINDEILLKKSCPPELYLPNAFSPNGDQLHDDLEIFGKHFKKFELKIFNRWGEIIFISTDRNIRWDGMYRGEEMPIGTYPWIISYQGEDEENQKETVLKGSITLIR